MAVAKRRDLRRMGHDQHLPALRPRLEATSAGLRGGAAAAPGAGGRPPPACSPARPRAPAPETEALDAADVEDAGQQQNVAPQPAPRAPEPTRPPHIEEPPADDDDLDLPSFLK